MIRGIDLQQGVVQSHLSEKIQQVQQQHPDMQQKYFSLQLQAEKKRMQEKVNDADEAQQLAMRDQPKKQREGKDPQGESAGDENPENMQRESDPDHGLYIDIKA